MTEPLKTTWAALTAEGAPFAMTTAEVRGIPTRVYADAPNDMRVLWELVSAYGDREYVIYEDERYTYADIAARVRSFANALANEYGVKHGDRVAVAMRNYPEWIIAYWATVSLGAALVGMNAWWIGAELEFAVQDSAPKVIVVDAERLERLAPLLPGLRAERDMAVIVVRADPIEGTTAWADVVDADSAPDALPSATIDGDDDACIFYTSGTTGFPKGAQITHRGSVHNLLSMGFWAALVPATRRAAQADAAQADADQPDADLPDADRGPAPIQSVLLPVPLFHVTGCNCVLHPISAIGGKLVLMHKWDAERAIELIEREQISTFTGVPTMSREMLASPAWATHDTSSLRSMGGGGAALQPDLVEKIESSLPKGRPSTGYGLTETCGVIAMNSEQFFVDKPDTVGPAVPVMDAKTVDDNGVDLSPGEVGHLWVRGPNIIKGYLNRPDATADAIVDGWFNTGDIARIDEDGFIAIVDRAKDIVIRGGENIFCAEVETAIYRNDLVAEAAVFGLPDERLGEVVVAAVVLNAGAEITATDLQKFLEPHLAKYKIPEQIFFLDEPLPQNANGKFVKRELRDRFAG